MTRIKFCGLKSEEDIRKVNSLDIDYCGFVFFEKSKRYIDREKAYCLKGLLDKRIRAVGVFLDHDMDFILSLLNEDIIDLAQLHGSEDEDFIKGLKKRTDKKIIKAFKIRSIEDLKKAENSPADLLLLDSGEGSGKTFNWDILTGFKREYLLAGGLDPVNVKEAIKKLKPYGVDVSSGIESEGKKDGDKMISFIEAVRSA